MSEIILTTTETYIVVEKNGKYANPDSYEGYAPLWVQSKRQRKHRYHTIQMGTL